VTLKRLTRGHSSTARTLISKKVLRYSRRDVRIHEEPTWLIKHRNRTGRSRRIRSERKRLNRSDVHRIFPAIVSKAKERAAVCQRKTFHTRR